MALAGKRFFGDRAEVVMDIQGEALILYPYDLTGRSELFCYYWILLIKSLSWRHDFDFTVQALLF